MARDVAVVIHTGEGWKLAILINISLTPHAHVLARILYGGLYSGDDGFGFRMNLLLIKMLNAYFNGMSNRKIVIEFIANENCFIIRPFTSLCCAQCLSNYNLPICAQHRELCN